MWLVKEWDSIAMTAATLVLILYGDATVTYYGILSFTEGQQLTNRGFTLMCVFQTCIVLSVISHLRCIFTSPGLTPRLDAPDVPLEELKFCDKCQQWKPPRTHHCSACKRCVHRMDHHCPWVNNCVAVRTHKYFLLFIFYFAVAGLLGATTLGYVGYDYVFTRHRYRLKVLGLIFATGGGTASLFFGLLGGALIWEQMSMVLKNQTTLDQWQKQQPRCGSTLENLERIFGRNYWVWLLPIAPALHIDYREALVASPQKIEYSREASTCRKAVLALSILLALVGLFLAGVYLLHFR